MIDATRRTESLKQEVDPLILPQTNRLHESFLVRGEDASNVAVAAISALPSRHRIGFSTHQIIQHWKSFTDLEQTFVVSRRMRSSAFTHNSALSESPRQKTQSSGQRWGT